MNRWIVGIALTCLAGVASAAPDRVRIAYFLEWPTPNLAAKAAGAYEAALGVPVTWIAFDTGTQMTEALAAGDVDIAYSQGLAPFVAAVTAGVPVIAVGVAVEYPANDCVIRDGAMLDPDDPASFAGASVALPLATMADYSFRLQMRELDVDVGDMRIVDRIPADAAIALAGGEVDLACGFGALAMAKMTAAGSVLMDAAAKAGAGIASFDVITVRTGFAREHPTLVRAFLDVTTAANVGYRGTPDELAAMGLEAGLDRTALLRQLGDFVFPGVEVQRTRFLGTGGIGLEAMRVVGEAFGTDDAAETIDYRSAIDPSFLP